MQEIAAEAGVNQALLHYYFRTKEQLARRAFERAAAEFMPAVIEVLASDAALETKVARVIDLEIAHLSRAPYLPGYILSELAHRPERVRQLVAAVTHRNSEDIHALVLTPLRAQLEAGIRRGAIRPILPEEFIINLMSLCIFPFAARPMISAILAMDEAAFEEFIARRRQTLVPFFLGALRP
jgi:TetR/AcrR family transcriptional regulator